ncbi:MAG: hypothetical protein ACI814_005131 [Mariniblastus sp.]|jgi:hypothetical protein
MPRADPVFMLFCDIFSGECAGSYSRQKSDALTIKEALTRSYLNAESHRRAPSFPNEPAQSGCCQSG